MKDRFEVEIHPFAECPDCDGTGWLSYHDKFGTVSGLKTDSTIMCECVTAVFVRKTRNVENRKAFDNAGNELIVGAVYKYHDDGKTLMDNCNEGDLLFYLGRDARTGNYLEFKHLDGSGPTMKFQWTGELELYSETSIHEEDARDG